MTIGRLVISPQPLKASLSDAAFHESQPIKTEKWD